MAILKHYIKNKSFYVYKYVFVNVFIYKNRKTGKMEKFTKIDLIFCIKYVYQIYCRLHFLEMSRQRKKERKMAKEASKKDRAVHKRELNKLTKIKAKQWTYINYPVEIPDDCNLVDYVKDNIEYWTSIRRRYHPDFSISLKKTIRVSLGIQTATIGEQKKYEYWDKFTFNYSNFNEGKYELYIDSGPNRGDCDCHGKPCGTGSTCDICDIPDGNYKSYKYADIIALLSQLPPGTIQVNFCSSVLPNMAGVPPEVSKYFTPIREPDGKFNDEFTFEGLPE